RQAWGADSHAALEAEDSGDSVLDDLLGLELGIAPTPGAAAEGALICPEESRESVVTAAAGGAATTGETLIAAGIFGECSAMALDETAGDGRGEGGDGEAAAVSPPSPFDGAELGRLCTHLNDRNRKAKRLAQRCQEMFLRLFFKDHSEIVQGLVLSLRSNGFIAYVPAFDAKGPVYISDMDGQVQVDPTLLGLSPNAGEAPSKGFATLPSCRTIPGASVSLVSRPRPATSMAPNASGSGNPAGEGVEEVLEVRPPPGSRGKTLGLRVLDPISLRLSCEVLSTQARLPKVRFLLAGVGANPAGNNNKPTTAQGKIGNRSSAASGGAPGGIALGRGELPRRGLEGDIIDASPAKERQYDGLGGGGEMEAHGAVVDSFWGGSGVAGLSGAPGRRGAG
ncbi:unnamed protein product, partial [Laminaria digitata]